MSIRIRQPDGSVVECDTPEEARRFIDSNDGITARDRAKILCAKNIHKGDDNDPNHCLGCGKCIHAGMC